MRGMLINELYDRPTIQGEGPLLGTPCTFMRLGACNLQCGRGADNDPRIWRCDSSYTWDWTGINGIKYDPRAELRHVPYDELTDWLKRFHLTTRVRLLIITGGEPLLQDRALAAFFAELEAKQPHWWSEWSVQVETNGTTIPIESGRFFRWLSVSPKLANSGNSQEARFCVDALRWFGSDSRAAFKFVASSLDDFDEIDEVVRTAEVPPERVYIMPEGVSSAAIEEHSLAVVDATIARGYNLTTRLHIQLFGNKRGV